MRLGCVASTARGSLELPARGMATDFFRGASKILRHGQCCHWGLSPNPIDGTARISAVYDTQIPEDEDKKTPLFRRIVST